MWTSRLKRSVQPFLERCDHFLCGDTVAIVQRRQSTRTKKLVRQRQHAELAGHNAFAQQQASHSFAEPADGAE